MPILAIRGNRRQETVSMPEYSLNEQNENLIFGIQLMERHVLAFKERKQHKLVPVLPPKREHRHNLRQSRAYAMPRTHTNRFKNTFIPSMCT